MRHQLFILLIASLLFPVAARGATTEAPADEYFGPLKQSILEIRNRLDRFDAFGDRTRLDYRVVAALDSLQRSIADWQRKYPRDPWIPRYLKHLLHEYERAGALATIGARQTLAGLREAIAARN